MVWLLLDAVRSWVHTAMGEEMLPLQVRLYRDQEVGRKEVNQDI